MSGARANDDLGERNRSAIDEKVAHNRLTVSDGDRLRRRDITQATDTQRVSAARYARDCIFSVVPTCRPHPARLENYDRLTDGGAGRISDSAANGSTLRGSCIRCEKLCENSEREKNRQLPTGASHKASLSGGILRTAPTPYARIRSCARKTGRRGLIFPRLPRTL